MKMCLKTTFVIITSIWTLSTSKFDASQIVLQNNIYGILIPDALPNLIDLNTKLIEALRIFQSGRMSALPVVDSEKRLRDIYSKFDIMHLAATRTYANLDVPLCDILDSIHDHSTHQLITCQMTDHLFKLMDKFVTREVHRLIIVDDDQHIIGILSISDLMRFFVATFEKISRTNSNTSNGTSNGPVFECESMDT
ncbi:unnamed protein product [Rotaria sordida]|uniref:CBS domain-containing protein n=1 Tax=Rotaria sordida TaxID=392033 RepID=A0A814DFF3_9BILA|nr:unnamed protein product [Rotaria sordida]CAF3710109.1 unnamed protein product [Rotaria sordida]CAF3710327.1 unnamed protein product [Rotaria sordida]